MPREPKQARPRLDPLLAALIEKLPAGGEEWPATERRAWLQMMGMAFDVVYGICDRVLVVGASGSMAVEATYEATGDGSMRLTSVKPAEQPRPGNAPYQFYIDLAGYVMKGDGSRCMPDEAKGWTIYDVRGEADLNAIIWADDSRGVPRGMQLEISAVQ